MTKKEVRDESKELQGDAQMKSRRQQVSPPIGAATD